MSRVVVERCAAECDAYAASMDASLAALPNEAETRRAMYAAASTAAFAIGARIRALAVAPPRGHEVYLTEQELLTLLNDGPKLGETVEEQIAAVLLARVGKTLGGAT